MNPKRAILTLTFIWLAIVGCAPLSQAEPIAGPAAEMRALAAQPAPSFTQCDPDQSTVLQRALQDAQVLALEAWQALESIPENSRESSARYREWFGAYDPANYSLVSDNFQHIYTALATQPITFNCACSDIALAYVYPNQPYDITVCERYWRSPATGTDSQAGVLVHEMSHFITVAATEDVTHSQVLVRMTAKNIPARAVQNASSYEYFAENDPPLR
jgi:peptidyl-Lys metalloendopeptidase